MNDPPAPPMGDTRNGVLLDQKMNDPPAPPTGVSLHFLTHFLDDNRLRRPLHKLGKPNANIEVCTIDQLRDLSKTIRLLSDHLPDQEFATYNNETIKRDAWVKQLKSVPVTTTHILECVLKQQITAFKLNNPTHQGTSFCELILRKHDQVLTVQNN